MFSEYSLRYNSSTPNSRLNRNCTGLAKSRKGLGMKVKSSEHFR
ncbi:uncharacterized protein M6B38_261650 [Iris pallida]|uniref:Uncharacterized protein n=1 Tax=Iris pallida TaxID=29817 RepID=A0AAX6IE18_IRIPA|nr:uncharacterized protein M6B38_261650 [Iris pallida]